MKTPELSGLLDSLPSELIQTLGYDNITTGTGYTQATFFGLIGFVLLTIAATAWGASLSGGVEESGRLELILAHAVGRVQYAIESILALLIRLLTLGIVTYLLIWAVNEPAELDLDPSRLAAGTVAWISLGLLTSMAAFAAGSMTGSRSFGMGAGAAIAVTGYVLQAVANNTGNLDWLRVISPFHWAFGAQPLTSGADWPGLLLLWGVSILLAATSATAMARRDILG